MGRARQGLLGTSSLRRGQEGQERDLSHEQLGGLLPRALLQVIYPYQFLTYIAGLVFVLTIYLSGRRTPWQHRGPLSERGHGGRWRHHPTSS
jgi:hypothetical protein